MLRALHLKNFTVFPDADLEFGKHLNVIVGENGLGKTQILKIAYVMAYVSARGAQESASAVPTKSYLQVAVANKLRDAFKPDELGRLARRQAGRSRCEIGWAFSQPELDCRASFNTASRSEVGIELTPTAWLDKLPVYLPTRELLTIYPGFVSLYETTYNDFEGAWRDTCILLGSLLARGPREKRIRELLEPLEEAMAGSVELDKSGRFYLNTKTGRMEMHLVAEGLRKLAMLARLIATGSLLDKGFLFWDEPEANLNPKLIRLVARTILQIGQSGIQVFIATHSLFLLRELYILQAHEFAGLDAHYFGLHAEGDAVAVKLADNIDEIGEITALDEDLMQSERYIDTEMGVPLLSAPAADEE